MNPYIPNHLIRLVIQTNQKVTKVTAFVFAFPMALLPSKLVLPVGASLCFARLFQHRYSLKGYKSYSKIALSRTTPFLSINMISAILTDNC